MRTGLAARKAVVARYRASGLTQAAFAAQQGIKVGTLQSWLYSGASRDVPVRGTRRKAGFVEVVPSPVRTGSLELEVGGAVVRLGTLPPPEWVATLVRELQA